MNKNKINIEITADGNDQPEAPARNLPNEAARSHNRRNH